MTLVCRSCGGFLEVGAALLVRPSAGAPGFLIHRPSIEARCIQRIGRADAFAIGLLDAGAAREFDRREGGTSPHPTRAWRPEPA